MAGMRAAHDAKRILKVRSPGLVVSSPGKKMTGTTFNPKGTSISVSWDDPDELSWSTHEVGDDSTLSLVAAHSYIIVSGADEEQAVNGPYVMCPRPFAILPEYQQVGGEGRIAYSEELPGWVLRGKDCPLYGVTCETLNLPPDGWQGFGRFSSTRISLTYHELKVGEKVKLRRVHADSGIPLEKYPGEACSYGEGDVCEIAQIDGLFFAPKISPDHWIPVRAGIPLEVVEQFLEDDDEHRLKAAPKAKARPEKKEASTAEAKEGKEGKEGKGKEGDEMLQLLKSLVQKVDVLEAEVKKLQK